MRLRKLAEGEGNGVQAESMSEVDIRGIAADSRAVREGFLFAALPGSRADGRQFIDEAVAKGAVAVLATAGTRLKDYGRPVALVTDGNPRRRLALMAARFHAPQPRAIAAVTGTNGKTSTAAFARQLWALLGRPAASLGTLGLVTPRRHVPGALTTPDPVELHRCLAELAGEGIECVAIEASSHGLDQYRLDGLELAAGAFTNLTHDHLDYHRSMAAYRDAKFRLFRELLPKGAGAVLNADAPEYTSLLEIARARRLNVTSYGRDGELRLVGERPQATGQVLDVELFGRRRELRFPAAGGFQAMNLLCALGLVAACGDDIEKAAAEVEWLSGVPGRIELVARHPNGAAIYVDYAHTPDALETVLKALRPHCAGRLAVVFGCGGDRDRAKRPAMGAIAERLADTVIVTDDNPRGEDPAAIRAQILAACRRARDVGDRAHAIREAIVALEPGDLLVVAGKGHETGQTIAGVTHPFDDGEAVRSYVELVAGGRLGRAP